MLFAQFARLTSYFSRCGALDERTMDRVRFSKFDRFSDRRIEAANRDRAAIGRGRDFQKIGIALPKSLAVTAFVFEKEFQYVPIGRAPLQDSRSTVE